MVSVLRKAWRDGMSATNIVDGRDKDMMDVSALSICLHARNML